MTRAMGGNCAGVCHVAEGGVTPTKHAITTVKAMSAVKFPAAAPTVQEVARIVSTTNRVIRNLEITNGYARLSAAVAARTGQGANWCTFATWASRQAGRTIRGEDLLENLNRHLARRAEFLHPVRSLWRVLLRKGVFQPDTRLGRIVREIHTPFDAFERTSSAVARGNLKVFEEIGREFARYLAECSEHDRPDSVEFTQFLDKLRPGQPPDGQEFLRRAFTRYQQQCFEPRPDARAELAALANLEIGLHEQTRLQPEIREALDAPFVTAQDLRARVLKVIAPDSGFWRIVVRGPVAALVSGIAVALQRSLAAFSREVITECLMVLSLPGELVLSLGQHMEAEIPECLRTPKHTELIEFLARLEPASPGADDCGAKDWSDLSQRMHYISHLFRAFHERADLCSPPFTNAQVSQIVTGTLPDGRL
jgi:hypothetical protein